MAEPVPKTELCAFSSPNAAPSEWSDGASGVDGRRGVTELVDRPT